MKRIHKIQKRLKEWEVDLLIIDNPIDLFYLTGLELSTGRLVIFEDEATLYVDGRYYEACKENASMPVALQSPDNAFPPFAGKRIGFDAYFTTYEAYEKLTDLKGKPVPLPKPMLTVRAVKEAEEISLLRQAAELDSKGFYHVISLLKEGITEEEVAIELELFWRKAGGEKVGFPPQIAFGANSAFPHHHVGKHVLKKRDNVLIDIGIVLNHYHSDMTRVRFFGEPNQKLKAIYQIVREAQLRAFELCKPHTPLAEIDRVARSFIEAEGYGEYFTHGLGHGVGLEIHEAPWVRKGVPGCLEEGMVLTIEPGIYLPGIGGVRLEDTIVITHDGFENLTEKFVSGMVQPL